MKVSDNTSVSMPMRNLISILGATALGVWAYFGVIERLNNIETQGKLMLSDVEKNTEFRIKYPRGELGQSSGEAELFMLVEHMAGLIESMDEELKGMRNNVVNIEFLKEQTSKLQEDVEKLIRNGNGH